MIMMDKSTGQKRVYNCLFRHRSIQESLYQLSSLVTYRLGHHLVLVLDLFPLLGAPIWSKRLSSAETLLLPNCCTWNVVMFFKGLPVICSCLYRGIRHFIERHYVYWTISSKTHLVKVSFRRMSTSSKHVSSNTFDEIFYAYRAAIMNLLVMWPQILSIANSVIFCGNIPRSDSFHRLE